MNRAIATVGLILWCGALPVRAADPAGEQTDQPIVVPFELLKTMHMAVKIKVNGKGPYRVIFDTGAPVNLLNNKIAHAANLLKKSDMPFFTVFGSNGPVLVRTFEVGKLKAADVPAIVMDHPGAGDRFPDPWPDRGHRRLSAVRPLPPDAGLQSQDDDLRPQRL